MMPPRVQLFEHLTNHDMGINRTHDNMRRVQEKHTSENVKISNNCYKTS